MCTMSLNPQFNGVELYFNNKPQSSILDSLKAVGYRWHNLKKCWYAKQNRQTMELAKMLSDEAQEQPEQEQAAASIPALLAKNEQDQGAYFPPYDAVGSEKIFEDSGAVSIMDERGGFFADICAHVHFFYGQVHITDLRDALTSGKECKRITIDFRSNNEMPMCKIFNAGAHTFKDVYNRYFVGTETDGAERYEHKEKAIETFTPFKRIPSIKTPDKWTLAHVWKAILSGQIYAGKVDGHYTDDYAYDAAENFGRGREIDLIHFAERLIDGKSGWRVHPGTPDNGIIPLSVCCHSFDCNTLYYDEKCTLEEGKRRREQAQTDKESRNAAILARVIPLNPEDFSKAEIYSVQHIEKDQNSGEYCSKTESMQWNDIFWTDTIYEGNNEREITECRLKVLSIATVAIDPKGMYCISNQFSRYNGDDERVIKSDCWMSYVTGYALSELLHEGVYLPTVNRKPIPFESVEKDLRMHFQTIHENGFACSKHSLFSVGDPKSFKDEHAKLLREWARIPQ